MDITSFISDERCFDIRAFKLPDALFYPALSWVWNAPVDREGIKREIAEMYDGGFRCFYIIPEPLEFRPDTMVTCLSPEYLSEDFFAAVAYAAECAKEKGMRMWLYDEGGWPSGSACGRVVRDCPEAAQKRLVKTESGFERKTSGSFRADITEPCAVERFTDMTHRGYFSHLKQYLGDIIPFMFTDEPVCLMPSLPYGFEDKFASRFGYRIEPFFAVITDGNAAKTEAERQTRIDYFTLIGETVRENFFGRCAEICHENSVCITGHLDRDHLVSNAVQLGYGSAPDTLKRLDIPGVDVICEQIMPPHDRSSMNEGCGFFVRFASSAAAQNGTKAVLSESFAVYGSGVTPDTMRYVMNYQASRGVNVFNFMINSYGREGFLAYSERPSFSPEQPGYHNLRALNDYTARLCYVNSLGRPVCETALYLPERDLMCGGDIARKAEASFNATGTVLEADSISFDIINDTAVREAVLTDSTLHIGDATYRAVVVPDCEYMPRDVAEKLSELSREPIPSEVKTAFRHRLRECSDGTRLIFAYNETAAQLTSRVDYDGGTKNRYRLDLQNGTLTPAPKDASFTLECGEDVTLIYTNAELPCELRKSGETETVPVYNANAAVVFRFTLDRSGMVSRDIVHDFKLTAFEPWSETYGVDFSGEVEYRMKFIAPENAVSASITLMGLEYTASVTINGKAVGRVIFAPYRITAENVRAGENTLEIRVCNTSANQFVHSKTEENFTAAELGTYHERAKQYEKKSCGGGLRGVRVEIIRGEKSENS